MPNENKTISAGTRIAIRTLAMITLFVVVYLARGAIAMLFIAVLIVAAIDPAVTRLHRMKVPRPLGAVLVFLSVFGLAGVAGYFLLPQLVREFASLARRLPSYFIQASDFFVSAQEFLDSHRINVNIREYITELGSRLDFLITQIYAKTVLLFRYLVYVLVVFILALFLAAEEDGVKKLVVKFTPRGHRLFAAGAVDRIIRKLGRWMHGVLFLMLLIFLMTYAGLLLIGIPYALSLAFLAGLLEVIPFIGPLLSAIPAVMLGLFKSPLTGLLAALLYIVIQQVHGQAMVPLVMKKAVGLDPVISIMALMVGITIGGPIGGLLAIPIASAVEAYAGEE